MRGKISKVLYNSGTYMLMSLKLQNVSDIEEDKVNPNFPLFVTIVGTLIGVEEGVLIEVDGEWNYTDKEGYWPWQFKVSSFEILEAETEETILRFLSSLPGIGNKIARLIFNEFGTSVYDIIEEDMRTGNRRLTVIKGISATKEDAIIASYKEKRLLSKTIKLLAKYNVGEIKIKNIINTYGEDTVELIKKNPYILSNDKFLSFKTTDIIAFDHGIGYDAADRIEAAVKNILDVRASSMGHTYLDFDDAVSLTVKMLESNSFMKGNIDEVLVKSKIGDFIAEGKLIEEDGHIYLAYRYNNENFVAKKLAHRAKLPSHFADASHELIEECIEKAQKDLHVTLASGQKDAVVTAIHNTTVIITGGPGTGKSATCFTVKQTKR